MKVLENIQKEYQGLGPTLTYDWKDVNFQKDQKATKIWNKNKTIALDVLFVSNNYDESEKIRQAHILSTPTLEREHLVIFLMITDVIEWY